MIVVADGRRRRAGAGGLETFVRDGDRRRSPAGPGHVLMGRAVSELHVCPRCPIGSAPAALDRSQSTHRSRARWIGADVQLSIGGVPPNAAVIAWEAATASGQPVGSLVPPHRLAAISRTTTDTVAAGPVRTRVGDRPHRRSGHQRIATSFCIRVSLRWMSRPHAVWWQPCRPKSGRAASCGAWPALSRQEQTLFENALAE